MADIIIGPQIVRCIVRLKMHGQHLVNVVFFECGLITIEIIRSLLVDLLHIRIQYRGVQNIILVKQTDIISGSQLVTFVGIIRDTAVMIQVLIYDTTVCLRRIFPAKFPDIGMLLVGTVCQTQLPVGIGLVHDAVQHLDLELSLIVPQRNENTDLRHIREYRLFLFFSLCCIGKASGSVGLHQTLLAGLVADLTQDILRSTAMGQAIPLSLCEMDQASRRTCGFPEFILFDPVQFELQVLFFRFQHYDLICQVRTFLVLPLVGFLIIDLRHVFPPSYIFLLYSTVSAY